MSILKLGLCSVCGENGAKYRCPKCETVTCSLVCSKAHKKLKNSCDGLRDKTKFVPMKNFTSMELVSDLSLLENAARYSVEKDLSNQPIKFEQKKSFQRPQGFQALQRACWRRNRCRLLGLPYHFSRHRENTSNHQSQTDTILWRITWMIPHHSEHVIYSDRISERSKLGDLIKNVLTRIDVDVKEDEISIYKTAQIKDLKILLKCEYVQPYGKMNLKRYTEMDIEKSLVWNLQEQAIVEHPTIAIVHKDHADFFVEDDGDSFVDVSKTSESNIEDEPSIFLGLNYNLDDSADDQMQSDQAKSVEKENTISIQKPPEKENKSGKEITAVQETNLPAATNQKPIENESKNNKVVSGLASLVCYGSSDDDEDS